MSFLEPADVFLDIVAADVHRPGTTSFDTAGTADGVVLLASP